MMDKNKCWMDDPDMRQCCCTCRYHRPAHLHDDNVVDKGKHGCICDIQVGWTCAMPQQLTNRIYINWDEHSIGCEMWNPDKDDIESL